MHRMDYLHSRVNSTLTSFFLVLITMDYNVSYYNALKELFLFVLRSFFSTLIDWMRKFEAPEHGLPLSILAPINPS